ncbi:MULTISPECIES: hypothetical protein [Paracoccaceae]|jgi:hypothetical protein|uniref:hypothetical protein n=1 Tax=Rhodobacterales TaxID=204455 RepID=UPI001D0B3FE2|nr:hypothetical protein [Boseongicola sp. H5]
MFHRLSVLALVFMLAACAAGGRGGDLISRDQGLFGVYSRQMLLSDDVHHVLMGHVIVATRGDETIRALIIHQRRDGVHRLRYSSAWRGGTELPYRSLARRVGGCTHGHCRDFAVGMIALSPEMIRAGARSGLRARLFGPSGAIAIHAPPALFSEALARAAEM